MEQAPDNDNGSSERLSWRLSDHDETGSVWLTWTGEGPSERYNLGPEDQVAEALTLWLAQRDYGERG